MVEQGQDEDEKGVEVGEVREESGGGEGEGEGRGTMEVRAAVHASKQIQTNPV